MPGIVRTEILNPIFDAFAEDSVDLTGAWALYLTSSRADHLKGSMLSVNWDIEEMERRQGEIVGQKGILKLNWLPVLPGL